MNRIILQFGAILLTSSAAWAEVPYLDDRSTAESLIKSLYNAVNRREFARAYDYFSSPPARNFQSYAKGYEGTSRVAVVTGPVTEEGAAGSVYYTVPVAIKSFNRDASEKIFAGCYTVRQVNSQNQEPPFRALRIESGKLKPSDAYALEGAYPDCGARVGPEATATTLDAAKTAYLDIFGKTCPLSAAIASGEAEPDFYALIEPAATGDEASATSTAQLFRFACSQAAYNESHVYLLSTGIEGLRPLALAQPGMDIVYEDAENVTLKSMKINGFESDLEMVNSAFDSTDKTISTFSKWRGVGDASSSALYKFVDGRFMLWNFDVDPTYDGQMNPYVVVENGTVLSVPHLSAVAE